MNTEAIAKLKEIGLNQQEAEVYYLLLSEEPMTAYKVGQLLKKPTANVYKAVEALVSKGAVIIEEGKNKLCRAVDPQEFVSLLESQFTLKAKKASQALSKLKPVNNDEKTYSLDSIDLIIEKTKRMIDSAKAIVVVDAFPLPLDLIKNHLEQAIIRGVEVVVQSYSPIEITGADVFITQNYEDVLTYWQSQQLNIVTDGKESVIALFDKTLSTVYHATWSTNVYLSCIVHAGRLCEQTIHKLMAVPDDSSSKLEEMEAILKTQRFFRNSNVPGVQTLFDRYRTE